MITKLKIADSFWSRLKGLMFKKKISLNEGMFFPNCGRVHTCFMKFDLCVIYLDKYLNVIGYQVLKPWKISKRIKGTKHILETSSEFRRVLKKDTKKKVLNIEEVEKYV
ncbi:DUF192 domain-containing protein [Proteinivorax tanatarense]|uniref:DUF192 domain-containing protein n=1 Tax=Proteinivorax tanatarense TaxID=1260629 RepID=A0AAU7VJR5_9FIRM